MPRPLRITRIQQRQLNREYESFIMNELYRKWIVMVSSKYKFVLDKPHSGYEQVKVELETDRP